MREGGLAGARVCARGAMGVAEARGSTQRSVLNGIRYAFRLTLELSSGGLRLTKGGRKQGGRAASVGTARKEKRAVRVHSLHSNGECWRKSCGK